MWIVADRAESGTLGVTCYNVQTRRPVDGTEWDEVMHEPNGDHYRGYPCRNGVRPRNVQGPRRREDRWGITRILQGRPRPPQPPDPLGRPLAVRSRPAGEDRVGGRAVALDQRFSGSQKGGA